MVLLLGVSAASGCAADRARSEGEHAAASESDDDPLTPLDAELERSWAQAGVVPSPLADDSEFVRRVSLDLIGRVPTQAEVEGFLADHDADKRERLVDELLASSDYAERWAELWAARLLPGDRKAARLAGETMQTYLVDVLDHGRPWDAVVTELLTADGDAREHPAAAFLGSRALRGDKRNDALAELSSTTARVFLGARIECAQCHDHPYVSGFSRADFWAQTAYFGRTFAKLERDEQPRTVVLFERRRAQLRVALDEAGEREQPMLPRYMGAEQVDDAARREQLAAHIVGDPRFAEATVGWVWTQLFGRGIVEPFDELLGDGERPPLLTLLATEFRASDHDLRALLRTIVLSQAYQRSSSADTDASVAQLANAEAVFARASVRPLTAEQLFASLLTVTELEQVGDRAFRRTVQQRKQAALREYEFVFGDDEMASADAFAASVSQALLLLNGGLTNHGVIARAGSSLDRITASSKQLEPRIEALWLTVYARRPSAAELELAREAIGDGRLDGWEDLMFAMLYSSEFTTNH